MMSKKEVAQRIINSHAEAYLSYNPDKFYDKQENIGEAKRNGGLIIDAVIKNIEEEGSSNFMGIETDDISFWKDIKKEVIEWED